MGVHDEVATLALLPDAVMDFSKGTRVRDDARLLTVAPEDMACAQFIADLDLGTWNSCEQKLGPAAEKIQGSGCYAHVKLHSDKHIGKLKHGGYKPIVEEDQRKLQSCSIQASAVATLTSFRSGYHVLLVPTQRLLSQVLMEHGTVRGANLHQPHAIKAFLTQNCSDGSASWVEKFCQVIQNAEKASVDYRLNFDTLAEWSTSWAILVAVTDPAQQAYYVQRFRRGIAAKSSGAWNNGAVMHEDMIRREGLMRCSQPRVAALRRIGMLRCFEHFCARFQCCCELVWCWIAD